MDSNSKEKFAIYAEAEGHEKPLIVINLPFARLFDDVVVPYQSDVPFFIDGVPLTRDKIKRLKILKQGNGFDHEFFALNRGLTKSDPSVRKTYGEQYHTRMDAILRAQTEDVTSQIIKAFDTAIKPSIKDYLPKRDELISTAGKLFWEAIKSLA